MRLFIGVIFLASLSGCAWFRVEATRLPLSAEAKRVLYALQVWRMEGRIGVQTPDSGWQANLFWEHDLTQDRLRVSGPLSQGMVSIVLQKDLIYINEGNGVSELSRDPESRLRERLGFAVPLSSLRYWILGVPEPDMAYTPLDGRGNSANGFQQSSWLIRVEESIAIESYVLPKKVLIQGSGVKLKIIADDWRIEG